MATEAKSTSAEGLCPETKGASERWATPFVPFLSTSRCLLPWAIRILPGSIASPSSASLTLRGQIRSRLFANSFVNPGGICCTTTIGTFRSWSSFENTTRRASGPPVLIPMAISSVFAGLRNWVGACAGVAGGATAKLKWTAISETFSVGAFGLYSEGVRTFLPCDLRYEPP